MTVPVKFVRRSSIACAVALALLAPATASAAIGDLDPLFSGDGKLITPSAGVFERAHAVAVQDDGKIVVAGTETAGVFETGDILVQRYTAKGDPDATFSGDGVTTIDFDGFADSGTDLAIDPGGEIVVIGSASSEAGFNTGEWAIVRLNPDGIPDPTFSGDGKRVIRIGGAVQSVALQGDGKIVLGGTAPAGAANGFALARLDGSGALDASFSGDGLQTTSFGASNANVFDLTIDDDGRIVAAGRFDAGANVNDFAIARYGIDGTLDSSFSGDGTLTTDFGVFPGIDDAHGVVVQPDGKIVVAGWAGGESSGSLFGIARYAENGDPDLGFSDDGLQTIEFEPMQDPMLPASSFGAAGVVLQEGGRIVVGGYSYAFNEFFEQRTVFALGALTPDGELDPEFGDAGKVMTTFDAPRAEAHAITLDRYRLVAAGWAGSDTETDVAIARYLVGDVPTYTVTVSPTGAGSGRVTGDAIDCPGDCEQTYVDGQTVHLTAVPSTGSTFAGWDGGCSGTATCTLEVTGDRVVLADFLAAPAPSAEQPPSALGFASPSSACATARTALDAATGRVDAAALIVARDRPNAVRKGADVRRAKRKLQRAKGGSRKVLGNARRVLSTQRTQHKRAKRALTRARERLKSERTRRTEAERSVTSAC